MPRRQWSSVAVAGTALVVAGLMCARPCSGARVIMHYRNPVQQQLAEAKRIAQMGKELLERAKELSELKEKWDLVVESLSDSKTAAAESGKVVGELDQKLKNIKAKIDGKDLGHLFDGKLDYKDLNAVAHFDTCLEILRELLSSADELEALADISYVIVELASQLQEFTDGVAEFAKAWDGLGGIGDTLRALLDTVVGAIKKFHKEASELTELKRTLDPLLRLEGSQIFWNADAIASGLEKIPGKFEQLQKLHKEYAVPIQGEIQSSVGKMVDAASNFQLPVPQGGGDHVATETIKRSQCDARNTHWFKPGANIDQTTMDCQGFLYGQFCSCKGSGDCYVARGNRQHDSDKKRCFMPVD